MFALLLRNTLLFFAISMHTSAVLRAEDAVEFNRDVRPILAAKCWACHGPDARVREADLRLDLRDSAIESAIKPGDIASSPLVERIESTDPDTIMPPPESRKKLSRRERETLKRWIAQGAKWQQHWAWIPPQRPTAPKVNAIDYFVRTRLDIAGHSPAKQADPRTLVRRLSFDLLGLPPEPTVVDEFVANANQQSYRALIGRFLSSPAFGERMAVTWLDLVRYADTNGYHADLEWSVSPYRDYVIHAFNANMPFDQFTREQIAGDLLPNATLQQKVAAGYNRLNMKSTEFGVQDKEYLAIYAADRVRATSGAWLGITLGCAECHDHKFDPMSTRDFYSFAAFFADIKGLGYYPDAQRRGWGESMSVPDKETAVKLAELEKQLGEAEARVLLPDARSTRNKDFRWRFTTQEPGKDWQSFEFSDEKWTTADGGFGSKGTPNGIIRTEWQTADIWLRRRFTVSAIPKSLILSIQHDEDALVFINGKRVAHLKGYSTASAEYLSKDIDPKVLRTGENVLAIHCHQTAGGQFIDAGLSTESTKLAQLRKQVVELRKSVPTMLATVSVKPRMMRILPRGNWMDESGEIVSPATPKAFGGGPANSRLDLAEWMVSRRNPLTARVFVNRLWKMFFGMGLTRKLDDVGSQGEWPSHPALLDWLAVEFMESDWNVKHMVRLIVQSETYQQSSRPRAELRDVDPYNRLLACQSRFRLDAEFIRDNALAVSGLLVRDVGGKSVKPYQPAGYWQHLFFPKRVYQHDSGPSQYRRGLYTHWQRQFVHPALLAFDAPSREECTAERARSNTPQAALVLLNDPTHVEAARVLAERTLASKPNSDVETINRMFRRVLSRAPTDTESSVLRDLLNKHRQEFKADPNRANDLLSIGLHKGKASVPAEEHAAWTSVARVLLNLHETITRN